MIKIEYPPPAFRVRNENGKDFLFDSLRKKWLLLTPEEWVRQNFIQYLMQVKGYPSSYIAMEKEIKLGELKKRFDVLVYNRMHQPWMMIECKGQEITLNDAVLNQVLRYNIPVPVTYIVITNGSFCYGWKKNNSNLELISELPSFED